MSEVKSLPLSDGQCLAYRAAGENNGGTPILLIHGLPDASDTWIPIATELGRSYRVYAVDLAAYGHSQRPASYDVSISAQAKYLVEFLDALTIDRVTLVGHDIGGGIAQIIAAKYPQRVERVVLINPIVDHYWPVLETRLLCVPLLAPFTLRLFEKLMWHYIISKGLSNPKTASAALIDRYQQWYRGPSGRRRLIRNARALKNRDLSVWSDAIRALTIPTLLLWGREDRYLKVEPAAKLCRDMQNCQFVFIEDAGHYVLDEQAEVLSVAIQKFLSVV